MGMADRASNTHGATSAPVLGDGDDDELLLRTALAYEAELEIDLLIAEGCSWLERKRSRLNTADSGRRPGSAELERKRPRLSTADSGRRSGRPAPGSDEDDEMRPRAPLPFER